MAAAKKIALLSWIFLLFVLVMFILLWKIMEKRQNSNNITIYGTNKFISYRLGDAASTVIISAPHGGRMKEGLVDRGIAGCYNSTLRECTYNPSCRNVSSAKCPVNTTPDVNTHVLAYELANRLTDILGVQPHVIRCEVKRSKLDVNRPQDEGTFGNEELRAPWQQYHDFIDEAKTAATAGGRRALYIDLHGQGTAKGWNVIGYLLPKRKAISKLVIPERLAPESSLMQIHSDSGLSLEYLVRGPKSIGAYLQNSGYDTVPSPTNVNAQEEPYYDGGYSLKRHTGWMVSGFQMEVHTACRKSRSERRAFAQKLAEGISQWATDYLNK